MHLTARQKQQWEDNGYLLLSGFYNDAQIDQINDLVDTLWKRKRTLGPEYVIDIFIGTDREKRVYFCDAPKEARKFPYKLNDLFLSSEYIRAIVSGQEIVPILSELLTGTPLICNSLSLEFGSQQEYHFDTFYMPSPTANKMVASWIALEKATPNSGPLSYYPGSHKIPPYFFSDGRTNVILEEMDDCKAYVKEEIEKRGLKPETLLAEKGDVLIWHSQLYHGGLEILDKKRTRKSLVTHYFTTEDFPDHAFPAVTEYSAYMRRSAPATGYEFKKPKSSLIDLIFSG